MNSIKINDTGVSKILSSLKENKTIKNLFLNKNKAGKESAIKFKSTFKENNILESLSMIGCGLTDNWLLKAQEGLCMNKVLTDLYI